MAFTLFFMKSLQVSSKNGGNERSQGLMSCHLPSASSSIAWFSTSGVSASPLAGVTAEAAAMPGILAGRAAHCSQAGLVQER